MNVVFGQFIRSTNVPAHICKEILPRYKNPVFHSPSASSNTSTARSPLFSTETSGPPPERRLFSKYRKSSSSSTAAGRARTSTVRLSGLSTGILKNMGTTGGREHGGQTNPCWAPVELQATSSSRRNRLRLQGDVVLVVSVVDARVPEGSGQRVLFPVVVPVPVLVRPEPEHRDLVGDEEGNIEKNNKPPRQASI
ncbi:hypothetical protein EYF80_043552 [Liparis tanakae]|uniref:Uncharacterized protein n=1 Tax=Liparis tanakae TaxID=230148 RepID=A0A4Z2FYC2_9TELE|nr:hypothetical protein EYF80_043552 [Liparis tanakae]